MKPADTVAYIRPICDVRVMEGREIREKRAKGTLKRDADEINEDESEIGSEEECKAESEINPSVTFEGGTFDIRIGDELVLLELPKDVVALATPDN